MELTWLSLMCKCPKIWCPSSSMSSVCVCRLVQRKAALMSCWTFRSKTSLLPNFIACRSTTLQRERYDINTNFTKQLLIILKYIQGGVKSWGHEGQEDHEPFPTLETVLCQLDQSCGFNIELKYGQLMRDGQDEDKNPMEINLFLDQILKTVLQHGGERKIVFSSFSPDVCTM